MPEESNKTAELSVKKYGEPVLFVSTDTKSKFDEKLQICCTILNVKELNPGQELTSETLYVQSLPFIIRVLREKRSVTKKGNKSHPLSIQLSVSKDIGRWTSTFSVKMIAMKTVNHPFEFEFDYESEMCNTHRKISKSIDWEYIAELEHLMIKINLSATLPNGGDYTWPSRAATGYHGIKNEGATCYINSLLQSLYFTNEFRRIVYALEIDEEDAKDSFVFWLKYIFYSMQFGESIEIRTINMINCFDWDEMTLTNQQDIQEFLRRLMDKLEQFVCGTVYEKRLTELFLGTIETTITCPTANYVKKRKESFWDIQLHIEHNDEIYGAFHYYLQKSVISDYEHENGNAEAVQERQFISMPPVLHIQLSRFRYNSKTNSMSKINKRFEYYSSLDLNQYCPGAVYTLHSVLVHSGKLTTGHYMAFISPKADNQWFKFNDEIVTKCSKYEAIESKYGNDVSSISAYILVYIKNSCIAEILKDVTLEDVKCRNLIEREMIKNIENESFKERHFELIVFTAEKLQMNESLQRGKSIMDQRCSLKFFIGKDKKYLDLLEILGQAFQVGDAVNDIRLWVLNTQKDTIRLIENDETNMELELNTIIKKDRIHVFIELLPMEQHIDIKFDRSKHAVIFIKHFDADRSALTFVGHQYFELNQTVQHIRAYIRQVINYEGQDEHIAIINENGFGETYMQSLLDSKRKIAKFITKNSETCSAQITFELLDTHNKSKYLSAFISSEPLDGCRQRSTRSNQTEQRAPSETEIHIIIKSFGEHMWEQISDMETELCEIVKMISSAIGINCDQIQLLDAENNLIENAFMSTTLQSFLKNRNVGMRTRAQKQNSLVFSYKIIDDNLKSEIAAADMHVIQEDFSICYEPMDCQYDRNSFEMTIPDIDQFPDNNNIAPIIKIKFQNLHKRNEQIELELFLTETLVDGICKFCKLIDGSKNDFRFFQDDLKPIEDDALPIQYHIGNNKDFIKIFFERKEFQCSSTPINRQRTPILAEDSLFVDQGGNVSLEFTNIYEKNNSIDLMCNDTDRLSKVIDQLVEIMELDRLTTNFYDSNDVELNKDKMNASVSKYLNGNAPKIAYITGKEITLHMQCVGPTGTEKEIINMEIHRTLTVGSFCDVIEKTSFGLRLRNRILKMKDDIIVGIVPPETLLTDILLDSQYDYRLDQYRDDIVLCKDPFFVCVRFVGKIHESRKKIPLLITVSNGESLDVLFMRVTHYMDITKYGPYEYEFSNHEQWTTTQPKSTQLILVKPENSHIIPVISLCFKKCYVKV